MSNFSQEAVRKWYPDPLLQRVNDISKRLASVENQTSEVENDDLVSVGDSGHSKVRFNDYWNFIKLWNLPSDNPLCTFEPDYNKFTLDLRFDSMGNKLYDRSGFNYDADIYGEPCPTTGVDVGFRGGSKKNTGWRVEDSLYCVIPDQDPITEELHQGLKVDDLTIGMSWIFRFNPASLDTTNSSPRIVEHYDDSNYNYSIRFDNDIKFLITQGGVLTKLRTNTNPITINNEFEVAITFNLTGNVIKFYINGAEITNTTTTTESMTTFNFNDTYLFAKVPTTTETPTGGFATLNMIDMLRCYKGMVLTPTQVLNHYNNKMSISSIAAGQVCITDASVTGPSTPSFNSPSFTTTSFTQ